MIRLEIPFQGMDPTSLQPGLIAKILRKKFPPLDHHLLRSQSVNHLESVALSILQNPTQSR